jgi:hypothetical protein
MGVRRPSPMLNAGTMRAEGYVGLHPGSAPPIIAMDGSTGFLVHPRLGHRRLARSRGAQGAEAGAQ